MFAIVKEFIFTLSDKDFLSILDGANFSNTSITVKRIYWNRLFGIISHYVELRDNKDKQILASVLRKVVLTRLASVKKTSFLAFFQRKLKASENKILNQFKTLSKSLSLKNKLNKISIESSEKMLNDLMRWLESKEISKKFRNITKSMTKRAGTPDLAFPILELVDSSNPYFKDPATLGIYSHEDSKIYIRRTLSLYEMKRTFAHEFVHWLFEAHHLEEENDHGILFETELLKLETALGLVTLTPKPKKKKNKKKKQIVIPPPPKSEVSESSSVQEKSSVADSDHPESEVSSLDGNEYERTASSPIQTYLEGFEPGTEPFQNAEERNDYIEARDRWNARQF